MATMKEEEVIYNTHTHKSPPTQEELSHDTSHSSPNKQRPFHFSEKNHKSFSLPLNKTRNQQQLTVMKRHREHRQLTFHRLHLPLSNKLHFQQQSSLHCRQCFSFQQRHLLYAATNSSAQHLYNLSSFSRKAHYGSGSSLAVPPTLPIRIPNHQFQRRLVLYSSP